jgi:general stress protein CsbA
MRQVIQVTLVFLVCVLAAASYKLQAKNSLEMIEGMVVSAQAGTLVVKDEKNRDHTHSVDSSAQVLVEGKVANLEDIQMGMKAHVTLDAGKVILVSATKPTRFDALAP